MQKNKELYELVTTLQDDLARCKHHIKELEVTLASSKDDLATKVNELTKLNMKLERSMQAKQVFSEKLLKENKKLQEIGEQKGFNQQLLDRSLDVPDGQASEDKPNVSCTEMVTSMLFSTLLHFNFYIHKSFQEVICKYGNISIV